MKTSKIGIDLIKHFEGLHDGNLRVIGLQPKKCPAGIWTEGYGIAMRDSKGNFLKGSKMPIGTVKTELEAEKQLARYLTVFENIVMRRLKVKVKQNQFDALVSHTFNTGGSSTLFRLVNENAPKSDIDNWFKTKYITGGGKVLKGLIARRNAEAKLFFHE